jgi:hypothetical protein
MLFGMKQSGDEGINTEDAEQHQTNTLQKLFASHRFVENFLNLFACTHESPVFRLTAYIYTSWPPKPQEAKGI